MKTITQTLMGKTAEWERVNPVLLEGMIGVEVKTDGNRRIKIGDGKSTWKDPALKALNPDDIEGLREELEKAAEMVKKVKDVFAVNKTIEEIMETLAPEDFESISLLLTNIAGKISEETDTRQQIIESIEERIANLTTQLNEATTQLSNSRSRIVGEYVNMSYELTDEELSSLRLLKLEGQIIEIALYQELVNKKWVGRERNATALFNYKCNENGYRNPDGLFFVVEDWRGMFGRVAGVNSILRTDMNNPLSSPYDGGYIGAYQPDDNKRHSHIAHLQHYPQTLAGQGTVIGIFTTDNHIGESGGIEAKPASLSEVRYIVY
jgi:hypothetical protein